MDDDRMLDDRSATAKAIGLGSHVLTISISMVLPALFGYWIDGYLGTRFLFLVLGALFGFSSAFYQLARLVRKLNEEDPFESATNGGGSVEKKDE